MTEDGWRETSICLVWIAAQYVEHGIFADMRDIYEHTDSVHFLDQQVACNADTVPLRGRGIGFSWFGNESGVRVNVMAIPGQSCVAYTKRIVKTESAD